jgi:hypothetical protein
MRVQQKARRELNLKRIDLQNPKQKKEEKHRGESCCGQRLMLKRAALPSDCGSAAQSTPNTAHQSLYFPKTFLRNEPVHSAQPLHSVTEPISNFTTAQPRPSAIRDAVPHMDGKSHLLLSLNDPSARLR